MYETVLVALDATVADEPVLEHVRELARVCRSKLVLLHVADGWAARQFKEEAVSEEVTGDQAYLERLKEELGGEGFTVEIELLYGEPAKEILAWVEREGCDLIVMGAHGHRWLADLVLGSTAQVVQHKAEVPILLVRAKGKK